MELKQRVGYWISMVMFILLLIPVTQGALGDCVESLADKNLHNQLDGLLDCLDERERKIIDERFGLDGRKAMTLEEVGREFGVTRERIRQLQNAALTKMRRALRKKEKPMPAPVNQAGNA